MYVVTRYLGWYVGKAIYGPTMDGSYIANIAQLTCYHSLTIELHLSYHGSTLVTSLVNPPTNLVT